MYESGAPDHLFAEFPAVPTEEWEELIRADLGGVDYDELLLWQPLEGLTVQPFYRSEHLKSLPHLAPSAGDDVLTLQSGWSIQQNIIVIHPDKAAGQVRDAAEGGVEIIGLDLTRYVGEPLHDLGPLLERIDFRTTSLHVEAGLSSLTFVDTMLQNGSRTAAVPPTISAAYDPISELVRSGRFAARWVDDAIRATEEWPPGVRLLQADAGIFHEAGADVVDETAFALAAVSEYVAQMIDRGMALDRILRRLYVTLQVGSSYFLEIARLRVLRLLLQQVVGAFDDAHRATHIPVHASISRRNMTLYDSHSNLLRATTEAASAVIGGCDVLVVHPFDAVEGEPSDFAYRLARNLQHLLRHEAYADRVSDPAAGSYYVEVLTDALGRSAWRRFQEIEGRGGLLAAYESGFVHEIVGASRDRLQQAVARQVHVLVGTNRYPDTNEQRRHAAPGLSRPPDVQSGGEPRPADTYAPPLELGRAAAELERLRLRTDRYAERTGRRPSAGILPCGEASARRIRTHLAANFLGCAGIEIRLQNEVETAAAVGVAAGAVDADLLVIAGPDACYEPDVLLELKAVTRFAGIGIVSAFDAGVDADFFIYPGADLVRTMSAVQRMLGVEDANDLAGEAR